MSAFSILVYRDSCAKSGVNLKKKTEITKIELLISTNDYFLIFISFYF